MGYLVWAVVSVAVFGTYKLGGLEELFRDWRHGRAVDKTEVWRKFEETFRGKV